MGGFAGRFVKNARRRSTSRRVVEARVIGFIAFVAGALGMSFVQIQPALVAAEAGAFLCATLTGFTAITLIERATARKVDSRPSVESSPAPRARELERRHERQA